MENKNIFETGAASLAANNLILSVMSDGKVHQRRIDAARRILEGIEPVESFRQIALDEAKRQRRAFYLRFKPQEITEAGRIIQSLTIGSILEEMAVSYDPSQNIYAVIRRWRDKLNGNSYFSCRVTVPLDGGKRIRFVIPFQYGYGSQPQSEIIETLFRLNILKEKKDYFREYNIILEDQRYMRKNQNWLTGLYL